TAADKPRIGDSATSRDEVVRLGQDPFMDFPSANLARVEQRDGKAVRVFVKYLGLLGPQGALPLATTEEAYHYVLGRDDAFPRFPDVFNHRFIQLFFRAWADARPIAQHDRPEADRFAAYIGSAIGIGSGPYRGRDSIPDAVKLAFAGLLGSQAKSASRLAGAGRGFFGVEAEIDEVGGSSLAVGADDFATIGGRGSDAGGRERRGGGVV